jgi:peptidoglycan/LPS O-acetylase OafA/YrhL
MEFVPLAAWWSGAPYRAGAQPRHAWIDLLKAVGIVSVVWIHAFCRLGENPPLTCRIAYVTRFAVPAFFFVAGFLQACSPRIGAMEFASRRLVRLMVPYLVASMAAFPVRQSLEGGSLTIKAVIMGLCNGDAFGIYYFVPLLVGVTAIGEVVFRYPTLAWPLWSVFAMLALLSETQLLSVGDLWWEIRNPLRWWGYFLAGWVLSEQRARMSKLPTRIRHMAGISILGIAGGIFCGYACCLPPGWSRHSVAMQYVMIYAVLLGTALTAWDAPCRPFVRWLSEASYPIYLYHYFVIMAAREFVWEIPDTAVFVVACGTTIIGVVGMRRTCGNRARLIIG